MPDARTAWHRPRALKPRGRRRGRLSFVRCWRRVRRRRPAVQTLVLLSLPDRLVVLAVDHVAVYPPGGLHSAVAQARAWRGGATLLGASKTTSVLRATRTKIGLATLSRSPLEGRVGALSPNAVSEPSDWRPFAAGSPLGSGTLKSLGYAFNCKRRRKRPRRPFLPSAEPFVLHTCADLAHSVHGLPQCCRHWRLGAMYNPVP